MSHVSVQGLTKHYSGQNSRPLFDNFSLDLEKGESFCVIGPNGCGKTTLLHIISGMEPYAEGKISIGNRPLSEARIGFVFQDYSSSLFPWKTVRENIEYALDCAKINKKKADNWINQLHLKELENKYPYQLSGGQRQRLAIARALSTEPELLILDEPFSALDFATKLELEESLRKLAQSADTTMLIVSHDVEQAVFLADRVGVLGGSPTQVQSIIPIDLPVNRHSSIRLTPSFLDCKKGVFAAYE